MEVLPVKHALNGWGGGGLLTFVMMPSLIPPCPGVVVVGWGGGGSRFQLISALPPSKHGLASS